MARINAALLSFAAGEVSRNAMARVDLERMRLSAEVQRNWAPRSSGQMMIRPGFEYRGNTRGNAKAKFFDFVYSASDAAAFEFTNGMLRIWRGSPLTPIARVSVATAINNGTFASATGWTQQVGGGGNVTYSANNLLLSGPARGGFSRTFQAVAVALADRGKPHGLRIKINNGKVLFRVGSTAGGQEYIRETPLENGYHSLEFTPTGATFYVQFENRRQRDLYVGSISVEAAGVVEIPSPYAEADLPSMRKYQDGDIVYFACDGKRPQAIERRSQTSFSIVDFRPEDGPFSKARTAEVRLKPSITEGNGTLTSNFPFFTSDHVGAIFELFHEGYNTTTRLGAENTFTDPIRVTGLKTDKDNDRDWSYLISGTWAGTIKSVRSVDDPDVGYTNSRVSTTSNTGGNPDDGTAASNLIVYYKLGFRSAQYTSGVATVNLSYDGGGGTGRCRVTGYTSPTVVNIEVLKPFNNVTFTDDWKEGDWSNVQGWPSAVGSTEGRLFWGKNELAYGSVSDVADSYDIDVDSGGDASAIVRTVSTGSIDRINWILALQRLCFGTDGSEITARSSSFDEPLTSKAFTIREASTQGSSSVVPAVKIDNRGQFVQTSNSRLYQLAYSADVQDYASSDLTLLNDEILLPGVVAMGVQRKPDTRTHCILGDGTAALLLTDFIEDVSGWHTVDTDGAIEDIFVLPGRVENSVFYVVRRSVNGDTVRYVEQWALESEAVNGTINKICDASFTYTGAATETVTGLAHLEGKQVVVWADGNAVYDQDNMPTVSGGSISLPSAMTNITVGLPYTARFKSVKLAYAAQVGTALLQEKRLASLGFILADAHIKALRFGPSFEQMDPFRMVEDDQAQPSNTVYRTYDAPPAAWPGGWNTDSRICLEGRAPYGAKVLGLVAGIMTHDRT